VPKVSARRPFRRTGIGNDPHAWLALLRSAASSRVFSLCLGRPSDFPNPPSLGRLIIRIAHKTNPRKKENSPQYAEYRHTLYMPGALTPVYQVYCGDNEARNAQYGQNNTQYSLLHIFILIDYPLYVPRPAWHDNSLSTPASFHQ